MEDSERMGCPNCGAAMDHVSLEGVYGPEVEIDLCFPCHLMWLDKRESIHLSPRGTLELFRIIQESDDSGRQSLRARLACPRCERRLGLSQDIGKGGRFSYYACPARDGRLTPFSEFLKEKQFVRALNNAEKHKLRAELKQVQCSSCGAPVDLMAGFACEHCGAPIAVLDGDAVAKTIQELEDADRQRGGDDPEGRELRARYLAAIEGLRTAPEERTWSGHPVRSRPGSLGVDLLSTSIEVIFGL